MQRARKMIAFRRCCAPHSLHLHAILSQLGWELAYGLIIYKLGIRMYLISHWPSLHSLLTALADGTRRHWTNVSRETHVKLQWTAVRNPMRIAHMRLTIGPLGGSWRPFSYIYYLYTLTRAYFTLVVVVVSPLVCILFLCAHNTSENLQKRTLSRQTISIIFMCVHAKHHATP